MLFWVLVTHLLVCGLLLCQLLEPQKQNLQLYGGESKLMMTTASYETLGIF